MKPAALNRKKESCAERYQIASGRPERGIGRISTVKMNPSVHKKRFLWKHNQVSYGCKSSKKDLA